MTDPQIIEQIKGLLSQHRRGMTLADIGASLQMHRNSVSKYMEILEARGEVESSSFGNTRVFYLTKRIPLSSLLNHTTDLVCMIDESACITQANPKFYVFFGIAEFTTKGKTLDEIRTGIHENPSLMDLFSGFLGEKEVIREITFSKIDNGGYKRNFHFRVKGIPTTFEDGASGTTLWMEDFTSEREHVNNLEFLARTSAELADMSEDADIYRYIVEQIRELEPGCLAGISSIDMENQNVTLMRVAAHAQDISYMEEQFSHKLEGFSFPITIQPDAEILWSKKVLIEAPKLYYLFFEQIPEPVTDAVEENLSLGKGYTMGCVCRGGVFGDVIVKLKKGSDLTHKETIEAFLSQAALALQRRHMREKLHKAEERIRMLEQSGDV
jgi:hypothetical protein